MGTRLTALALAAGALLILAGIAAHFADRDAAPPPGDGGVPAGAGGPCAPCHDPFGTAAAGRFREGAHASAGVGCLDCHRALRGQSPVEHHGHILAERVTPSNCRGCHAVETAEFARSRHAAPAWTAVSESPVPLPEAIEATGLAGRCRGCHDIGRPNPDGSVGRCSACHAPHLESAARAREGSACTACHAFEDRHAAGAADCAGCHFGSLAGIPATHDPGIRLRRGPGEGDAEAGSAMAGVCLACHLPARLERFLAGTGPEIEELARELEEATAHVEALRQAGLLTPRPLDEPLELLEFELWHDLAPAARHAIASGCSGREAWEARLAMRDAAARVRASAPQILPPR